MSEDYVRNLENQSRYEAGRKDAKSGNVPSKCIVDHAFEFVTDVMSSVLDSSETRARNDESRRAYQAGVNSVKK